MATNAELQHIPLTDEYGARHNEAYGAILKARFIKEEGFETDEIGGEYEDIEDIIGAACEVIFYTSKEKKEEGLDPRYLREKDGDEYGRKITIDGTSAYAQNIIKSDLPRRDKLIRIIMDDLNRRT